MTTKTKKPTTKTTSNPFDVVVIPLTIIKLPYPPSINRYYSHFRNRVTISAVGRAYRDTVRDILLPEFSQRENYALPLQVWVEVKFPDRRKRDLDNLNKALLDSLTHSTVWDDDSLIHDLRLVLTGVEKPGYVRLHIGEIQK